MTSSTFRVAGSLVLGLVFSLAVLAADGDKPAEKKKGKAQETCPVMGGKINKAIFAEYEGQRVYFCCQGCPPEFAKDPAKYVKKLEDAGVVLEKVQTTCPVMEAKINKKIFSDYAGQRIYFCCQDCVEAFAKDPAKYVQKLTDAGVTPEPAPAAPTPKPGGAPQ